MKKVIHHIRRQPEEVRRHILHVTTGVLGLLLFFLWIYSLGVRISNREPEVEASLNDTAPLSVMKANLVDGYRSISE